MYADMSVISLFLLPNDFTYWIVYSRIGSAIKFKIVLWTIQNIPL